MKKIISYKNLHLEFQRLVLSFLLSLRSILTLTNKRTFKRSLFTGVWSLSEFVALALRKKNSISG